MIIQPVAVLSAFRVTLAVSAAALKIPLIQFAASTWLSYYYKAGKAIWPSMLNRGWLANTPSFLRTRVANLYHRIPGVPFGAPFHELNFLAKKYGVKKFKGSDVFERDDVLIHEPPNFSGVELPGHCHYVGPILRSISAEIPPEVKEFVAAGRNPLVVVSPGTVGWSREETLFFLKRLPRTGIRVLATVGQLLGQSEVWRFSSNILITSFLPIGKILKYASAAVITGGVGSLFHALDAGVPIVGIGLNPEQENNLECAARHGLGISVRQGQGFADAAVSAIFEVLRCSKYKSAVDAYVGNVRKEGYWNGASNAASYLGARFA